MYKLLVTGSRDFEDAFHVRAFLQWLLEETRPENVSPWLHTIEVTHGDARGLDTVFENECKRIGIKTRRRPADWNTYGKRAGRLRNEQMLEEGPYDLVYGCPLPGSIGTWHMLRIASKAGLPCKMRHPKTGKMVNFHWTMEASYK